MLLSQQCRWSRQSTCMWMHIYTAPVTMAGMQESATCTLPSTWYPLELFRWDIPSSLRGCIRSQIMLPFTFLDSTADLKSLCKQKWLLRKWWNNQTGTNDSAWLTEGIQRCIGAAVLTGKALCHSVLRCSAVPRCNSLFQDFVSGT